MAACQIAGHPDSYGLGIRIAFYLEWFGMIITPWLLESDALNLHFLNMLTVAATSIGLAVNLGVLQPAEVYVVLLLVCGTLHFLVPVFLWRLLTCCHPWWDPERWSRVRMGWLFKTGLVLMFGTLVGVQIWFWCTGVYVRPTGSDTSCRQYAFLFGQVPIDSSAVTAVNIILYIAMLVVGTWKFSAWIGIFDDCRWYRRRKRRRWSITKDHILSLQQLRTISDLIVASILTAAAELAISWNNINGVNHLDSAAQLIPPVISGAYFVRSIYVWMFGPPPEQNHYIVFPYFPGGSGGSGTYSYTIDSRNMAYTGSSRDWASRRRHSHRHHRRHRRNTYMSPGMVYEPEPAMAGPEMAAAPPSPAAAASAAGDSRHATVVDAPDGENAAEAPVTEPEPAAHPASQPEGPA